MRTRWGVGNVRSTRAGRRIVEGCGVALSTVLLVGATPPTPAQTGVPAPGPSAPATPAPVLPITAEGVMTSLNQALGWYRQSQVVLRSVTTVTGPLVAGEDERTALRILQRDFDTAHAEAALVTEESPPTASSSASARSTQERAAREADVKRDEEEVARLADLAKRASRARRPALERDLATAQDRLELDRVRLDFVTRLGELDTALAGGQPDLAHQIQALQDAVPELRAPNAAARAEAPPPPVSTSSPWPALHQLLALQRARGSLGDLATATGTLERDVDARLRAAEATVKPIAVRLRSLTTDTDASTDPTPLAEREQEFHQLLDRAKLIAATVLPLRDESTMLHRYAGDLTSWERAVDSESRQTLQALGVGLIGVAIALVVILVAAVLWRITVVRYVTDRYRRRVLLIARNVVVAVAIVLVVAFHFTSELAALVTGLGVAAAGIAFALQNVILAVAGYFTIVAPNGIRVGDRVSLQGPFGYVHGEVIDIGITRLRLHELAGEPLRPTGRIVVFPNSVVFTGSFFKDPPEAAG